MQLDHILLASDLTEAGRASHRYAAALARAFRATVTALHVDEVAPTDYPEAHEPDFLARLERVRRARLATLRDDFRRFDVPLEVAVVPGRPRHTILEQIAARRADLVVVARHARRGVATPHIGSTARRVVRHSPVPVLVVPAPDSGVAPPEDVPRLARLLTSTDLSPAATRGARAALDLARRLDGAATVVHVVSGMPDVQLFNPAGDDLPTPLPPLREQELARSALAAALAPMASDRLTPVVRIDRRPEVAIAKLAEEDAAELVALAATGHGAFAGLLLGDTAARVIKRAPVPVLVFPRPWLEAHYA